MTDTGVGPRRPARRVLIALGGNAIGADGGSPDAERHAVEQAMHHVADLISLGYEVTLTHGNGPQVGNLLLQSQLAADVVAPLPLDWCGAQTQASLGLLILNALDSALGVRRVRRPVAVVVTRTLVSADDPAFADPVKPVGRYFPESQARRLMRAGQVWRPFGGRGWRRVVASPRPLQVIDAPAVTALLAAGHVVVAGGGGGVPVVRRPDGTLRGVEAVIDKDLAAAVLAHTVQATTLIVATDVEHAMTGYGTPRARPIERTTVSRLRELAAAGHFAAGSMGPKVQAALEFVEGGGRRAVITSLDRIADAVTGKVGTVVEPD